jgi:hypothetical protein
MISEVEIKRLEAQEVVALEIWKTAARRWLAAMRRTAESWTEEERRDGTNLLTIQSHMRTSAKAWAEAELALTEAREKNANHVAPVIELIAASNDGRPHCSCYTVSHRDGTYSPVRDPKCLAHGYRTPAERGEAR